jgi:hypothetical protein
LAQRLGWEKTSMGEDRQWLPAQQFGPAPRRAGDLHVLTEDDLRLLPLL